MTEDERLIPSNIEQIVIDHVDRQRKAVAAFVVTRAGTRHRLGFLRGEGWFCTCSSGKRCRSIKLVKKLVPPMGDE